VRTALRNFRSKAPKLTPEQIATSQGWTLAQMNAREDEARRSVHKRQGRMIQENEDRDRRARAERLGKQIAAEGNQKESQRRFRCRITGENEIDPVAFVDSLNR